MAHPNPNAAVRRDRARARSVRGVAVWAVTCGLGLASLPAAASEVIVGGQAMYSSQDIVENAANSAVHRTLVAAVERAELVDVLKSPGPFTVFAPTDDAFENLPAGTLEKLLEPKARGSLRKILTYHVVEGELTAAAISREIAKGDGKALLKTVSGGTLTARLNGPRNVILIDENGNTANIVTYDVMQSNGVIHVIDAVVLPK